MQFRIGFEQADRLEVLRLWEEILTSHRWTGGRFVPEFERLWGEHVGGGAVAFSSWSGAALAALEYFDVSGRDVLCPSNTFMATPLVTNEARAAVDFLDCSRADLCLSARGLRASIRSTPDAAAVWLVHIGGHIAFDVEEIAQICREEGVRLLEDCAHAHGATWNNRAAGTWGDAGIYSFHATKTISTGEGGMLVSRNPELLAFARAYRDYGKPDYRVQGVNHRMSEFAAALGCVQTRRLPDIVAWKNEYAERVLQAQHPNRVRLPDGMISGLYKYIVFDPIERSTGKVYDQPCHRILGHVVDLPNTDWVAANHWTVPLYFKGDEE